MSKPHLVILGAGPAGLGAAYQLARRRLARVTVLEEESFVGGIAGSFDLAGSRVDFGSHRLHPACDPVVLRDIQSLLGDDLLVRPRHGRIRLRGRWISFPLKPLEIGLRLPPGFALGVATDLALKPVRHKNGSAPEDTFATVLAAALGETICRDFYFPYARKLWGTEPEELSVEQARRRISAGSLGKMVRRVLSSLPGLKPAGYGRFYYPRFGFGQISEAYCRGALDAGADVHLGCQVSSVEVSNGTVSRVSYMKNGQSSTLDVDYLWSTIPITSLARYLKPSPPEEFLDATDRVEYRSMILVYLVLNQDRFSEYDAHYFPEPAIPISRLSEPKNYGDGQGRRDQTILCAELPCAADGYEWKMGEDQLGQLVLNALRTAEIPVRAPIGQIATRRLRHAYPIYRQGYASHFDRLDHCFRRVNGLLTFGRQGLFAHDNTHHALHTAYCAVGCLDENGQFDRERWQEHRRVFATHVVED